MVRISEELLPAAESLDVVHHRSYWAVKNRCNKLPYSQKIRSRDLPGSTGINRDADSRVRKRIPGPVFGPERRCRGFNNLRGTCPKSWRDGFAGDCPSPPPSRPDARTPGSCRGKRGVFPWISGDFCGHGRSAGETRGGRGEVADRCARDHLASRVSWSGVDAPGTPAPRKADLGSGAPGTAQCCRPIRVSRWPHQVRIPLKLRVASR